MIDNDKIFFYNITKNPALVNPGPFTSEGTVIIETDTVTGASPYIFNISMRSVWGMQGMHAIRWKQGNWFPFNGCCSVYWSFTAKR